MDFPTWPIIVSNMNVITFYETKKELSVIIDNYLIHISDNSLLFINYINDDFIACWAGR